GDKNPGVPCPAVNCVGHNSVSSSLGFDGAALSIAYSDVTHLARSWWKAQHDTANRRGRLVDGNAFAALLNVPLPSARVGVRLGGFCTLCDASVEAPRLLKTQPGYDLGAVPWSLPAFVVLGHLHVTIFFADVPPSPLQQSGPGLRPRRCDGSISRQT